MDGGTDAGWTVSRKTVTEGGRDGHGTWAGWSRKVGGSSAVKNERFTVFNYFVGISNLKNA